MISYIRTSFFTTLVLMFAFGLQPGRAGATLVADLQGLVIQAENLDSQLQETIVSAETVCGPLVVANQAAREMVNSIILVDQSLAAPLQVDSDVLAALDELFVVSAGLASESLRLSLDLQSLDQVADALTLKDGITAMLQLSEDIGTMADRIGEMADKILVMSDNIGLMADRILVTQEIQNQNVLLTQQSILQTQTNMLTMVSVVETSTNDLSLEQIVVDGELLAARMLTVVLNPWNMKRELEEVAVDVHALLDQVQSGYDSIVVQSTQSTMYVNSTSLTSLSNMSIMLNSLATAIDGYVVAIEGLQAITSSPTLEASLQSMLQLSADIGVMANRILEMGDTILSMADNIGLMADQILATQELQNINVATTQSAILAAQEMVIAMIVAENF